MFPSIPSSIKGNLSIVNSCETDRFAFAVQFGLWRRGRRGIFFSTAVLPRTLPGAADVGIFWALHFLFSAGVTHYMPNLLLVLRITPPLKPRSSNKRRKSSLLPPFSKKKRFSFILAQVFAITSVVFSILSKYLSSLRIL